MLKTCLQNIVTFLFDVGRSLDGLFQHCSVADHVTGMRSCSVCQKTLEVPQSDLQMVARSPMKCVLASVVRELAIALLGWQIFQGMSTNAEDIGMSHAGHTLFCTTP